MPLIIMFHGGGKKLDLREIKGEVSLRELLGMKELPASCTVGDWLRRMGRDGRGLSAPPGLPFRVRFALGKD